VRACRTASLLSLARHLHAPASAGYRIFMIVLPSQENLTWPVFLLPVETRNATFEFRRTTEVRNISDNVRKRYRQAALIRSRGTSTRETRNGAGAWENSRKLQPRRCASSSAKTVRLLASEVHWPLRSRLPVLLIGGSAPTATMHAPRIDALRSPPKLRRR